MEDGLDILIAELKGLKGKAFWQRLVAITKCREFKMREKGVYSVFSSNNPDFNQLMNAARKAQSFGFDVFILPNPKGIKSADLILRYKNSYKLYELKTIHGQNSIGNRLTDAIDQSMRVLLNLEIRYNPRLLAFEIANFFRNNKEAKEVLVFYRRTRLSITNASNSDILWRNLLKKIK